MRLLRVTLHVVVVLLGCDKKTAPEPTQAPTPEVAKPGNSAPQKQPTPPQDGQTGGQDADLKTRLAGRWFPEGASEDDYEIPGCYCGRCLNIQFDKTDEAFCVESNQISVSAYYELDTANKKVNLYFKEPGDLGAGGASLPWGEFDRTKPIAVIDASGLDKNTLKVDWIGFVEKGKPADKQSHGDFGSDYEGVYHKQEAK